MKRKKLFATCITAVLTTTLASVIAQADIFIGQIHFWPSFSFHGHSSGSCTYYYDEHPEELPYEYLRDKYFEYEKQDFLYGLAYRLEGEMPSELGDWNVYVIDQLPERLSYYEKDPQILAIDDPNRLLVYTYQYFLDDSDRVEFGGQWCHNFHKGDVEGALELTDTEQVYIFEYPVDDAAHCIALENVLEANSQFSYLGEARFFTVDYEDGMFRDLYLDFATEADFEAVGARYQELIAPYDYTATTLENGLIRGCVEVKDINQYSASAMVNLYKLMRDDPQVLKAEFSETYYDEDMGSDFGGCGIFPHPQAEAIRGDVSGDGTVDADDAVLALREYVTVQVMQSASLLSSIDRGAADVNADGSITDVDATLILRYATRALIDSDTSWDDMFSAT